jgi:hypothetical protein
MKRTSLIFLIHIFQGGRDKRNKKEEEETQAQIVSDFLGYSCYVFTDRVKSQEKDVYYLKISCDWNF